MKHNILLIVLSCLFPIQSLHAENIQVYEKVKSVDELKAGNKYIIVRENDAQSYAMGEIGKVVNGGGTPVPVTIQDEKITISDAAGVYVVELVASDNVWKLKVGSKYITGTSNATNLTLSNSMSSKTQEWIITMKSILNSSQNSRAIRYSEKYGCFKDYYNENNSCDESCLYRQVSEQEGVALQVGAMNYATLYYSDKSLVVPDQCKAFTYRLADGQLAVSKTYLPGQTIPAGTAVVVAAPQGCYPFLVSAEAGEADADNLLRGSDSDVLANAASGNAADYYFYMLSLNANSDEGSEGFYFGTDDGSPFTSAAHKAYLVLPKSAVTQARPLLFTEMVTAVRQVTAASSGQSELRYAISGHRVGPDYRGIVIVQGKKKVVR